MTLSCCLILSVPGSAVTITSVGLYLNVEPVKSDQGVLKLWMHFLSIASEDWQKKPRQVMFWMDMQRCTVENGFILRGIQNMQNVQLNLSGVHRQNGSFFPLFVPRCKNKALPPVMLCSMALWWKHCYSSDTALFIFCLLSKTEWDGWLYAFYVSRHAVLQFSRLLQKIL